MTEVTPSDEELIALGKSAWEGFCEARPEEAKESRAIVEAMSESDRLEHYRRYGNLIYGIVSHPNYPALNDG